MGMNYFLHSSPPCKECGNSKQEIHIGKQSAGWAFLFRGHEDIRSVEDLFNKIMAESYLIKDEEGKVVFLVDFMEMIGKSKHGKCPIAIGLDDDYTWVDGDGYCFDKGIFS